MVDVIIFISGLFAVTGLLIVGLIYIFTNK
jgi:hypothetical protein